MNHLLDPFRYGFMQDALLAAAVVGAVCAVLSCYLVLKGWSLMGDAVSHAVLPGIVIAYVMGLPLAVGAFASGMFCAVGAGYLKANSRVKEDTVLGITFTGMFALGLVLFSKIETDVHLNHILFGSLLGIPKDLLWQTIVLGGFVLVVILVKRRDLLLFCFDPTQARAVGINTTLLHYLLLALLSLTIVVSLQAVGIILVVAMLVTPGCVGFLWATRFDRMLAVSVTSALTAALLGTYISFFLDGSTGACIVLIESLILVVSLLWSPRHGWLRRRGG